MKIGLFIFAFSLVVLLLAYFAMNIVGYDYALSGKLFKLDESKLAIALSYILLFSSIGCIVGIFWTLIGAIVRICV